MTIKISVAIPNSNKIKIFENKINLGCYLNKIFSVEMCKNDWCILLDSDNIIKKDYIERLYSIPDWNTNYIYAPDRPITFPGNPSKNMDYRMYSNKVITKEIYLEHFSNINFQCLINTCNYFLPKKEYIECMNKVKNNYIRKRIDCLDSAILFTDWLLNDKNILVLENLGYFHRLHSNSNYSKGFSRKYENTVKKNLFNRVKNS